MAGALRPWRKDEEIAHAHAEPIGNSNQRHERDVQLSGLDFLKVSQVELHGLGCMFKGPPGTLPEFPDPQAKPLRRQPVRACPPVRARRSFVGTGHAEDAGGKGLLRLRHMCQNGWWRVDTMIRRSGLGAMSCAVWKPTNERLYLWTGYGRGDAQ